MSQIRKKFIQDDAVGAAKIRLENDSALRARNAADDADVVLIKLNASDELELLQSIVVSSGLSIGSPSSALSSISSDLYQNDGAVSFFTTALAGETGLLSLSTGGSSADASGAINITSGSADLNSGQILLGTGESANGDSGSIRLETGSAVNGVRGNIIVNAGALDMGDAKIILVGDPTDETDAANKRYVDTEIGTISSSIDAVEEDVADLVLLSGVAVNSQDLGSFTGNIIPDNSTVKEALQALETDLDSIPDPLYYAGTYDASTNTPALSNGDVGVSGALYQVTVAGTQDFGAGNITFAIGDKVVNNGSVWEKWDQTDAVDSVNGQTGVVELDAEDIPYDNGVSGLTATDVQAAIDELASNASDLEADVADLITLSGVAANSEDLGTFTGSIIPDSSDIKEALQALETAVESSSGANTTLSNLTSPTSINQNLLPSADVTRSIGSSTLVWDQIYSSEYLIFNSGSASRGKLVADQSPPSGTIANNISLAADGGRSLNLFSDNISGADSGSVRIESGNATAPDFNSGNIVLRTGTVSGTGIRGSVLLEATALDMNAVKIVDLADPTADQDAATKKYVDDEIAAIPAGISYRKEQIELDSSDITAQSVTLAETPLANSIMVFAGGICQLEGIDYSLTGDVVAFLGDLATGGAAELEAGDYLVITYSY